MTYEGEMIIDGDEKRFYAQSLAELVGLIRGLGHYDEMTILVKDEPAEER